LSREFFWKIVIFFGFFGRGDFFAAPRTHDDDPLIAIAQKLGLLWLKLLKGHRLSKQEIAIQYKGKYHFGGLPPTRKDAPPRF
jgi:hypothetical protein